MDIRELLSSDEWILALADSVRKHVWSSMPAIVDKDGDGHTVTVKSSIKGKRELEDGTIVDFEYPVFNDLPIHFAGGGGVSVTHPTKAGDEGIITFVSRAQDAWHQSGGVQQPIDTRMHSLSDGRYIPGGRSDPRKLKNVSNSAHHIRSDDAKVTHEIHPTSGHKVKTVDPSWSDPGDGSSNPFAAATKFFEHIIHPSNGHAHNATDGGTTHSVTNDHASGPKMAANNGEHSINAHPSEGTTINSTKGKMQIKGQIESTGDGFKFPDGTVQKSAAISAATFGGGSSSTGGSGPSFPSIDSLAAPTVNGHQAINGPAFRAFASVGTSVPSATQTKIAFDTLAFDTDACFDHTTNFRFQPTVAGYYQITGGCFIAAMSTHIYVSIHKNGSESRRGSDASATSGAMSDTTGLFLMNGTTDYVEMWMYQDSGSTQTTSTGAPTAFFEGAMVRGM